MAGDIITVTGLEETMQMLRDAPKTVVARGFVKALNAAGNVIAGRLAINAPVKKEDTGGLLDNGELRDSVMIAVELDTQFRGGSVSVGFTHGNAADSVALWLEYGHRKVTHAGKEIGEVAAIPFMRDTADQTEEQAADAFDDSIAQTVREEFPQSEVA